MLTADHPDRALFYGEAVAVRPAEFRLLCALARSPGKCIRYETLYASIWEDGRFAEPAQVYSHRSRLCRKLAAALPERDPRRIVVTVPLHGLMLNLCPEDVRLE